MKRARYKRGSVVFDSRRKVWNFLYCVDGRRRTMRIGTKPEYPSKTSAWVAAEALRLRQSAEPPHLTGNTITVKILVEQYRAERMPQRHSTRLAYEAWLSNHIIPRWGDTLILSLQARDVELWLRSLPLSPKSKAHIRGLLHALLDYAMCRGHMTAQRNVMELVSIHGATKRTRQPRSLTVEEFQKFVRHLDEPFNVIALVSVCFGLRISETLGLRWDDIDRINSKLRIERGISGKSWHRPKLTVHNRR
jgi:integrase